MKKLVMMIFALWSVGTSSGWAQTKNVNGLVGNNNNANSGMYQVGLQIHQQLRQIKRDLKAGRISSNQAQTARAALKAIRQQELSDFQQNGQKEITAAQQAQLNALLMQNAKLI